MEVYPPYRAWGYTYLHDPLAVATLMRQDLVGLEPLHVDVELAGAHGAVATLARTPTEAAPANAQVALAVDVEGFEAFLPARIGGLS